MIFGKEQNRGLVLRDMRMEVVTIGEDGVTEADILVHDETREDPSIAFLLSRMEWPEYPVPVGVLRAVEKPTYDDLMRMQIEQAQADEGAPNIKDLFLEGDTWTVE
jgi:2-oxoglutarate ferredoxin oxidoreductase subunit beta